jgi:chromosome segregation ATPase
MFAAAQAEQLREQVKLEVGALDGQLMAKEATLKALTDQARGLESAFSTKIADLQKELSEKQSFIENRNAEISELQSQITDLLEQGSHLERANREGLEKHRIAATDLEQSLRLQLNELQNQLADKQAALAARADDVLRLESQVSAAELAVKQAEAKAADSIEQMRRQSESQLESLQTEMNWKLEDLQRREAATYSTEVNFHAEIEALRVEITEKRSLLENRNDELLRVKAETDGLKDRVAYLEAAAAQAEATNKNRMIGEQDRVDLEERWNELGQTAPTLERRQAAVNDSEGDIEAQSNGLRSELSAGKARLQNPNKNFLLDGPTLSESQRENQREKLNRLEQLVETIKADNEQTLSPHNRRWRFSLGRKRRWKS